VYAGGGRIIHYAPPSGFEISPENATVHETSLEKFKDGCEARVVDFPEGNSAEETLRRARSRLGEHDYNLATNNCDHFATWCKTGKHRSIQVEEVKDVLRLIAPGLSDVVCTTQKFFEDQKVPHLDAQNRISKPKGILDRLSINTNMTDSIAMSAPGQGMENTGVEKLDLAKADDGDYPTLPKYQDEDAKKPKTTPGIIDNISGFFKGVVRVAGAVMEVVKHNFPVPLNLIPFHAIGVKAANIIDKIKIKVKLATGKITPDQARSELLDADTVLLGATVARKLDNPVKDTVKNIFGKVGVGIKQVVEKVVTTVAPKLGQILKPAVALLGHAAATGIRVVKKVFSGFKEKVKAFLGF
jgi:hypothetical protein